MASEGLRMNTKGLIMVVVVVFCVEAAVVEVEESGARTEN